MDDPRTLLWAAVQEFMNTSRSGFYIPAGIPVISRNLGKSRRRAKRAAGIARCCGTGPPGAAQQSTTGPSRLRAKRDRDGHDDMIISSSGNIDYNSTLRFAIMSLLNHSFTRSVQKSKKIFWTIPVENE
jgi:hypothetical protein